MMTPRRSKPRYIIGADMITPALLEPELPVTPAIDMVTSAAKDMLVDIVTV